MFSPERTLKRKRIDEDLLVKKGKLEDLEVTGVSRSGRVRKKSSKLTDFESPDDLDSRYKRGLKSTPYGRAHDYPATSEDGDVHFKNENILNTDYDLQISGAESEGNYDSHVEEGSVASSESDVHSDVDGVDENQEAGPSQSLYLFEKSKKKVVVLKDGRLVLKAKTQRKDKGKSRFTAYMLWAKGIRNELTRSNPSLDFSAISKKLGELWATVPNNEKYNWRRRAKRLALRIAKGEKEATSKTAVVTQFINKAKLKSTYKLKALQIDEPSTVPSNELLSPRYNSGMYKVTGTQPLDIAAHLKVLGESLSIIGERLKDHEGQIAVSGSLSVLLDSLLCSIGPLMCLTQQLPLINNYNPEGLQELLDNIAYVMPGL